MAEAAATIPNFTLPAIWIPYDDLGRSPAGFVWDDRGSFGPYRGQIFCGDQYSAEVFRMSLDRVGGKWQGACYPFRRGLKCGITRLEWAPDGSLWCGLTDRGWGSLGKRQHGLQRLVWRGEEPFDLVEVTARPDGFRLRFTRPLDPDSAVLQSFSVRSWTYDHHEAYGCPPRDVRPEVVQRASVVENGLCVDVAVERLDLVRVYHITCDGIRDGAGGEAWHPVAWYTLNRLPE